jgi:NAD(P)-dependent dehydrogenase (short-subunit alcohol dehydrogenase family)
MTGRLDGMIALVTGGASGIGEATARRFVAEGARVFIADRQQERGEELADALRQAFVQTDVSSEDEVAAAVDRAVSQYGRLDCMINNAGYTGATGSLVDLTQDAWHATLKVLLDGVFFGIKHAARVMIPAQSGCILTTTSIAGQNGGMGPHAYTTAKHAIGGLISSVASEISANNVRVNAVAPGAVATPLSALSRGNDMAAAERNAQERSPLPGAVSADEIAGGFVYLASHDGRHITGQTLVIDGGLSSFYPPRAGLHDRSTSFYNAAGAAK